MGPAHQAWLSLGSNMGDRLGYLLGGAGYVLANGASLRDNSGIYETVPVGVEDQEDFYNMAIHIETGLEPMALLRLCQRAEAAFHRERVLRWGPRTLDVDILLYDELTLDLPELTLPHPRMGQRAFVLGPLAEISPALFPQWGLPNLREGIVLKIPARDVRMMLVDSMRPGSPP